MGATMKLTGHLLPKTFDLGLGTPTGVISVEKSSGPYDCFQFQGVYGHLAFPK